mgnify:FL=1|jgi:hypothetical protein
MRTFDKYKQNLRQQGDKIWSYSTHVATIIYDEDYHPSHLKQLGYWGITTQKHINYAARELNLEIQE